MSSRPKRFIKINNNHSTTIYVSINNMITDIFTKCLMTMIFRKLEAIIKIKIVELNISGVGIIRLSKFSLFVSIKMKFYDQKQIEPD